MRYGNKLQQPQKTNLCHWHTRYIGKDEPGQCSTNVIKCPCIFLFRCSCWQCLEDLQIMATKLRNNNNCNYENRNHKRDRNSLEGVKHNKIILVYRICIWSHNQAIPSISCLPTAPSPQFLFYKFFLSTFLTSVTFLLFPPWTRLPVGCFPFTFMFTNMLIFYFISFRFSSYSS